ncbi:RL21-like protein [Mya arenaria]|uniref:RL21-like protein n=1 Tax=Mya arenaria TaxID=6604 RepID=A0ABY7DN42_MYAAR|nr:RL21-like protein [Mya arenaria]
MECKLTVYRRQAADGASQLITFLVWIARKRAAPDLDEKEHCSVLISLTSGYRFRLSVHADIVSGRYVIVIQFVPNCFGYLIFGPVDIAYTPSPYDDQHRVPWQAQTDKQTDRQTETVTVTRNRILPKRVNLRVEHVKHSNCRLDFLKRVKSNSEKLKGSKASCTFTNLKREPVGRRTAHIVRTKLNKPQVLRPIPLDVSEVTMPRSSFDSISSMTSCFRTLYSYSNRLSNVPSSIPPTTDPNRNKMKTTADETLSILFFGTQPIGRRTAVNVRPKLNKPDVLRPIPRRKSTQSLPWIARKRVARDLDEVEQSSVLIILTSGYRFRLSVHTDVVSGSMIFESGHQISRVFLCPFRVTNVLARNHDDIGICGDAHYAGNVILMHLAQNCPANFIFGPVNIASTSSLYVDQHRVPRLEILADHCKAVHQTDRQMV